MSDSTEPDLGGFLSGGRLLLAEASERYGRRLGPEDYWWMGVGLAAATLAELGEKPYSVGRIEQLIDQLGHKGLRGDWFQRFADELAGLDAEGLLWPLYQRGPEGPIEPAGATLAPEFDAQAGYFLALGHIGVALALHREDQEAVSRLAESIAALVESGSSRETEEAILASLKPI